MTRYELVKKALSSPRAARYASEYHDVYADDFTAQNCHEWGFGGKAELALDIIQAAYEWGALERREVADELGLDMPIDDRHLLDGVERS